MGLKHLVVIHLIDVIPGQDQKILRVILIDEINVLGNRIRGSAVHIQSGIRFFPRCQNKDARISGIKSPAGSCRHITVQQNRLILGQDTDNVDAAVRAIAEREVNDTILSSIIHRRLRNLVGELVQPASAPAGEDHSQHITLFHDRLTSIPQKIS